MFNRPSGSRQPGNRRLRFHEGAVPAEASHPHAVPVADLLHQERILFEGEGMEVPDLAQQFPTRMNHWFDQLVPERGRDLVLCGKVMSFKRMKNSRRTNIAFRVLNRLGAGEGSGGARSFVRWSDLQIK